MTFVANLSTLIDIAFVGFVSFACWRSMRSAAEVPHAAAELWRNELKELEKVLRSLIDEAGTASAALDRRLARRKEEIEALLKRAEGVSSSTQSPRTPAKNPALARQRTAPPRETEVLELEDDLPNESWGARAKRQARELSEEDRIEQLVSRQRDTVQLSKPAGDEELNAAQQRTFAQLSMTDPIAYKIARRLLSQGIEIHVVARKLDVPLSEIRVLDRLMREEVTAEPELVESSEYAKRVEPVPGSKIVRNKQGRNRTSTFDVELTERDEVHDEETATRISEMAYRIERGSALL